MKTLVSIIVPVYNVKQYINQCLDSLINQSLNEIEIIIVNDGSTDGSGEICRQYEKKDQRVKLINKENGGLSDARNVGLKYAEAEYVGFIDSDDYVDINFYEELYKGIRQEKVDVAVARINKINEKKESLFQCGYEETRVIANHAAMKSMLTARGISNSVCNKLFRRVLFEKQQFPVGKLYEDEFVTYRIIDRCSHVYFTAETSYYYRVNQQGITHGAFSDKELDRIEASLIRLDYMKGAHPELVEDAKRYLMFDSLTALSKMDKYNRKYDNVLKKNIRFSLAAYLRGRSSFGAKGFSVLAAMSPRLSVFLYRIIRG